MQTWKQAAFSHPPTKRAPVYKLILCSNSRVTLLACENKIELLSRKSELLSLNDIFSMAKLQLYESHSFCSGVSDPSDI